MSRVLLQLFLWLILMLESARSQSLALSGCPDKCGNISIPYPFGIGAGCYLEPAFSLVCPTPNKPLVWGTSLGVLDISLEGHMRVPVKPAYSCLNLSSNLEERPEIKFVFSHFAVSDTMNKLTGIGCDGFATLRDPKAIRGIVICATQGYPIDEMSTGLPTTDQSILQNQANDSCEGWYCCQASVPGMMRGFHLSAVASKDRSSSCNSSLYPCQYAFLVEDSEYKRDSSDFSPLARERERPVVLEWWVGKNRCSEAKKDSDSYACKSQKSVCLDSKNGPGYLCNCSAGYKGNPYLSNGCQDINECGDPSVNHCLKPENCRNSKGNYTCLCPKGHHGDGRRDGTGCVADEPEWAKILVGTIIGLLAIFLGISLVYWRLKQRRIIKLREKFFLRNGGLLLRQQLSKQDQSRDHTQVFSAEELKKATENYHESRILGQGGQGTVYKGILPDSRMVAIKRAKIGDSSQVEEFINELLVLSQINHRNVVKILGCCLETEVPLLVYEFVTNGTLFDHIHDPSVSPILPWETRLKIAVEAASALSYLHSAASIPIIHRDIKSANILLDDNYTTKVSDFGTSRLIPVDQEELTTLVRGTLGYLDPEYFHTSHLNEKSDVYSFGVVLLELLTGERALSFCRPESERHLVTNFDSAIKKNRLLEILDKQILKDGNFEQLQRVADLAMWCVRLKGDERPRMKDVAIELESLRSTETNLAQEVRYHRQTVKCTNSYKLWTD